MFKISNELYDLLKKCVLQKIDHSQGKFQIFKPKFIDTVTIIII